MAPDDFRTLANEILHADSEAEVLQLIAPLTTEQTEKVAHLVETGAMKARVERERAKGRSFGSGAARILRVLFAAFPLATFRRLGKRPSRLFHSEKPVSVDARSAYNANQPILLFQPVLRLGLR
jgi:hypothetical protein